MNRAMTEAVETRTPSRSPLDVTHQRLGAMMIERDGWSVPANYGDVLFEYAAVRERGAGVIDLSARGRILVSGSEAVPFLNGLITNVKGRLIASVRVVRLKDEGTDKSVCPTFLIDTEPATHERVLKTIERFTLAGDFRITDITSQTTLLSVQGKKAAGVGRSVFGEEVASLDAKRATQTSGPNGGGATEDLTVIRATHTAEEGFDVIVNSAHASATWDALHNAGAQPVGYDALEILRIEAGLPRYGMDMDDTNVVTETSLDDAVSYTKGCYVGQEIIARIKYRGHVARKLSGITFAQAVKVEANAIIKSLDDKDVGRITSITYSPHLGRTIALGYLKYDYLAPGTEVKIVAGAEEFPAQVTKLPFVRGSGCDDENKL